MNAVDMRRAEAGFTLLELVVAMGIFALMSAMAFGGLKSAGDTREHTEKQTTRLAELQKAFTIIGRDVEQTINRSVRNIYADELPPIKGSAYGNTILELSRNGRRNPMFVSRSNMQRVDYVFAENSLIRQSWPVLDQALDSVPYESMLLDKVSAIDLRFMDADHQWQPQWPSLSVATTAAPPTLPRAVEVTLDLEDWGRVTRIFEVVG